MLYNLIKYGNISNSEVKIQRNTFLPVIARSSESLQGDSSLYWEQALAMSMRSPRLLQPRDASRIASLAFAMRERGFRGAEPPDYLIVIGEVKMSIDKVKKKELREAFGYHPNDSGSSEVQIAVLTERIKNLTGHLSKYKKDQSSKKGLLQLVMQRRNLLDYLKNKNIEKYRKTIKALGLRR